MLCSKEAELHVLFNNAQVYFTMWHKKLLTLVSSGVMVSPVEMKTANGYDLQFGTNVLGHYLFTTLLLPTLIHTAQKSKCFPIFLKYFTNTFTDGTSRVVHTSSGAHWAAPRGGINYTTLEPNSPSADTARIALGSAALHAQSKYAIVALSAELSRRYASQGIISCSLHPGSIRNEWHNSLTGVWKWIVVCTRLVICTSFVSSRP